MFCANCGAQVPDGTKFCPSCGKPCSTGEKVKQERMCLTKVNRN